MQGENSVKILGPDLDELEELGKQVVAVLSRRPGRQGRRATTASKGSRTSNCPSTGTNVRLWNISVANVHNVIQTAIGGKTVSQMIEGEKSFDITLRWPERLREDETDILDIPVDVTGHLVTGGAQAGTPAPRRFRALRPAWPRQAPALRCRRSTGSMRGSTPLETMTTPARAIGRPGHAARRRPGRRRSTRTASSFAAARRPSPAKKGTRLVAVKFGVRDRDLASAVNDAQGKVDPSDSQGLSRRVERRVPADGGRGTAA